MLLQNLTLPIVAADVQDDKYVAILTEDDEIALTEDEIWNLFQDTSSKDEFGNEWPLANLQAL